MGKTLSHLLCGRGFGLAYGPANIAAVTGVAPEKQRLAGGLINTSFQFGGALVLAIVTAVANAAAGSGGTAQATLHGFHTALFIPLGAAVIGVAAMLRRPASDSRRAPRQTSGGDRSGVQPGRGESHGSCGAWSARRTRRCQT